jgi:hypothetical protein
MARGKQLVQVCRPMLHDIDVSTSLGCPPNEGSGGESVSRCRASNQQWAPLIALSPAGSHACNSGIQLLLTTAVNDTV